MTTRAKVVWLRRQIAKDRSMIRFWRHHRFLAVLFYPAVSAADVRWARTSLRIASRNLARLTADRWPPHHALWLCISRFEGGVTSDNGSHYGMLQMSYDWMGVIKGKASDYPQVVQEWAAEHAWAENHYSASFLYGQWFDYDGAGPTCNNPALTAP
jgi:hypothetical protein